MSKRRNFDFKGYPCDPHNVTDDCWYYVEPGGILVCQHRRGIPMEVVAIPWTNVRRALKDHDAAPERRLKTKSPRF